MPEKKSPGQSVEITISWATIFKILAACVLALMAVRLWSLLELLFLSLLIAITLLPIVKCARNRGWPRWVGVSIAAFLVLAFLAIFFGVLIPALIGQAGGLIKNLPAIKEELLQRLPAGSIRGTINRLLDAGSFSNPEPLLKEFLGWGSKALQGILAFFLVVVVAIYFLIDGERVYQWILAFLPPAHRRKMAAAAPEIAGVVSSYMIGQLITSVLCSVYVFVVLIILHVPAALLLAALAGVFDILPLIGFFLTIVPTAALAMTVSPVAAGVVIVLYAAYHLVENYFVVPKVYGDRLRLSTLTVLVSCLAGALLAGIVGAIAVLPIVASYPIVERIWLRPHLEDDTVARHEELEEKEHPGG
jgi:predicted PurR-regulated permease PerM